ncbi:MAG: Hsp20/alpha crystallin family protein [Gammaproteobacteria bacterium]|nr:Hsp20/alpha crystallin family protein [Gammaproteobacteria bacterium]
MSESDKDQPKQRLITLLIAVLIVVSGIQIWYMMGMRHQLDDLQAHKPAPQTQTDDPSIAEPETPKVEKSEPIIAKAQVPAVAPQTRQLEQPADPADDQTPVSNNDQQQLPEPLADNRNPVPANPGPMFRDDFFNTPFDRQDRDPYEEIERMQRDIDRMFSQSYDAPYNRPYSRPYNRPYNRPYSKRPDYRYNFHQQLTLPEIDVKEDRTQYIVLVNLPGADKNDISVSLDGQRLTIKGRRKSQKENMDPSGNIVIRERRSGNFHRSITLPEPVIEGGMKSRIKNGVLTIVIPKDRPPA